MPLDGFKMQTAGAMMCDSHHVPSTGLEALVVVPSTGLEALVVVPSTGLEALVVVSRYSIVRLAELAPVLLSLDRVRLGLCNHWFPGGRWV